MVVGQRVFKNAFNRDLFSKRKFVDGPHPFENLKRVETPTTYIDEARVARVPKRTDMFARAQFGDMGKNLQEGAKGGYYARKAASCAQRRALGAFVLLQDGEANENGARPDDLAKNAANIKAASYFWAWMQLGCHAVPIGRGTVMMRRALFGSPHNNAVSMIIDQGYETMEGASGDDWISVAQSMRAYLRFSLLGGVIANKSAIWDIGQNRTPSWMERCCNPLATVVGVG